MVQIKKGNLLTSQTQVIGHQTNCKGISGGLAGIIFKTFPECWIPYLQCCKVNRPLGKTQLLKCNDGRILANIFGQYEAGAATNYRYVLSGLKDLRKQMESLNLKTLSLPYGMGAGIGGGDWNTVYGLIEQVFGLSSIEVTLCKLEN